MKVLFFLPGLGNGGAERVFLSLNSFFKKNNIVSQILCATKKGDLYSHINTNEIDFLDANFGLLSFLKLKKYINNLKPDVIIATLSSSIISLAIAKILCRKKNIIYIARVANILTKPFSVKEKIIFFLESYFINKYDLIICNSNATKKSLELFKVRKNIDIKVIYNPVIEKKYEEVKQIDLKKEKPIILTVGRLVEQKRIDHTIRAFAKVRKKIGNGHLIIIGNGILLSQVESEISKNKILKHTTIMPYHNNIPDLLKSVDCFINTSKYEGFGSIFIESIAYCKNTLAYESKGGASELLGPTNSILVPDGNEDILADKLYDIVTHSKNVGNENKEYIQNFSKEKISLQYLNQIKKSYEKNSF